MINRILTEFRTFLRNEGLAQQVEAALQEFHTPADWDRAMHQWNSSKTEGQAVAV